jgi:DNA-binding transcriptional MocR family regulator
MPVLPCNILPLTIPPVTRIYIAERYRTRLGTRATAEEIQIVNGSQQCLDLFAKIFLNPGDHHNP